MADVLTFCLYIVIIFSISVVLQEGLKHNEVTSKTIIVFASIVCAFFAANRGHLGTDTDMYVSAYNQGIHSVHRWVDFEYGFCMLVSILKGLGVSSQGFLFTLNFFTMFFAFLVIDHEKSYINVFLASFLCMTDFYFLGWNVVRQALAISVSMYAMCIYIDNKKKRAILLIIIAAAFHTSAWICIAIIVGKQIFDRKCYKKILVASGVFLLFLVLNRHVLGEIIYFLTKEPYYMFYFTRNAQTEGGLLTYYLKQLPVLIIAILGMKNYEKHHRYRVFFSLMMLGFVFSSIGAVTATQVQRVGYYFTYFTWIVLGCCANDKLYIGKQQYISPNTVVLLVVIFEIVLFAFNKFYKGYAGLTPYPWF